MKNIMVDGHEFAAKCCIICDKVPTEQEELLWSYFIGALPIGAMTCSEPCFDKAMKRFERTGRLDTPEQRYSTE